MDTGFTYEKPIEFFTKEAIARIEYGYNSQQNSWNPKLDWHQLDCDSLLMKMIMIWY